MVKLQEGNDHLYLKLIISESMQLKSETPKTYPAFLILCVQGKRNCVYIYMHTQTILA